MRSGADTDSYYRLVAVFPTIDKTLAIGPMVACTALSASCLWSRRIRANVLCRLVLKLAVYRNEGSRIDFIWPLIVSPGIEWVSPAAFRKSSSQLRVEKLACVHSAQHSHADGARTLATCLAAVSAVAHRSWRPASPAVLTRPRSVPLCAALKFSRGCPFRREFRRHHCYV